MKAFRATMLALACLVLAACGNGQSQDTPAMQQLRTTADALGGLERIEAVRNISMLGYGQWAYQFGGGNISGDANAPMKWIAANDLRRVYDLENERFQFYERRNFLFPFALIRGHDFRPINQILDGDIAYDISPEGTLRRLGGTVSLGSAPRDLKMWMLANPVTVVRTALAAESSLGELGREGDVIILPFITREGYGIDIGIEEATNLPAFVRWVSPQDNMGQLTHTVHFTGYVPFDDLLLPLGYNTVIDWRDVDYMKIYVDNYFIDSDIPDLAAPADIAASPEPAVSAPTIEATQLADRIWRLSNGTTVFEFSDHLVLYEMYGNQLSAQAGIDYANQMIPGKRATHAIISHHHQDHTGGFRAAVASGLQLVSHRNNEGILREWAERRAPDFPDLLERNWQEMRFIPVDEHLRLQDEEMTLDIYWGRENRHMAHQVFAYAPEQRILAEADMATAADEFQWWADSFFDAVEYYGLEVDLISPVHLYVMDMEEIREFVRGGVERARVFCAAELEKNNYFPGCPVQTDRF